MEIPRPEYPRPIFQRDRWINLNGRWSCHLDLGRTGHERKFPGSTGFDTGITVPFCPESELSGVGFSDFIPSLWYHRVFQVPPEWSGSAVLLCIGAADYETEVYIDGRLAGRHWGGSTSFGFDITSQISFGQTHNLVIAVHDDLRTGTQPGGKQSLEYASTGCFYTRTTGIWQTVWLEARHPYSIENCFTVPLFESNGFSVLPTFTSEMSRLVFRARALSDGAVVAETAEPAHNFHCARLMLDDAKPWSPEDPHLYDLELCVETPDGEVLDKVSSYTGLRKFHWEGNKLFLNNEPIYLRFVLDQGFYPDGIWTAPSEYHLRRDIEIGMGMGFNGARLHQKVFESRYHYWADKLGYLTWAESPSWGLDLRSDCAARNFLSEWREILIRDRNHPSIIGWTPLNETWDVKNRKQHHRLHCDAYDLTRSIDATRPINDASGGCHVKTDLYTVHIYEQDPAKLRETLAPGQNGAVFRTLGDEEAPYLGQPYLVDEFGGIKLLPDLGRLVSNSWGYGDSPSNIEDFFARLEGQVRALLSHPHICGFCYTQLTDVEQEQNGLFYYDRTAKFDSHRLKKIFSALHS